MAKNNNKTKSAPREKNPSPAYAPAVRYRVRVAKDREVQGYVDSWENGTASVDNSSGRPSRLRTAEVGGRLMTRAQAITVANEICCSKSEYGDYVAIVVGS